MQRGDTLGAIARKFDVTVSDLMAENNITDPTKVRAGQKLTIPGFHAVGTGAVPSRTPGPSSTPTRAPAATTTSTPAPASNPPALPPPVVEGPLDGSAPGVEEEAPPVQPIEGDPMPAP
jgi:LysM repeat protein